MTFEYAVPGHPMVLSMFSLVTTTRTEACGVGSRDRVPPRVTSSSNAPAIEHGRAQFLLDTSSVG